MTSRDELGEMAADFNAMTDYLTETAELAEGDRRWRPQRRTSHPA